MKKIIILILVLFSLTLVTPVLAQSTLWNTVTEGLWDIGKEGYGVSEQPRHPAVFVGGLIRIFLSVMGVVFIVILVIGGYKWMTAGGDEEDVKAAKNWIKNGVIGIVITFLAYGITVFVVSTLMSAVQ